MNIWLTATEQGRKVMQHVWPAELLPPEQRRKDAVGERRNIAYGDSNSPKECARWDIILLSEERWQSIHGQTANTQHSRYSCKRPCRYSSKFRNFGRKARWA
jgi:hypothetical protein